MAGRMYKCFFVPRNKSGKRGRGQNMMGTQCSKSARAESNAWLRDHGYDIKRSQVSCRKCEDWEAPWDWSR